MIDLDYQNDSLLEGSELLDMAFLVQGSLSTRILVGEDHDVDMDELLQGSADLFAIISGESTVLMISSEAEIDTAQFCHISDATEFLCPLVGGTTGPSLQKSEAFINMDGSKYIFANTCKTVERVVESQTTNLLFFVCSWDSF